MRELEEITMLSWNHINADTEIQMKSEKCFGKSSKLLTILDDVSGEAYGGELLAIMGASGAGKTTLLNILTGSKSKKVRYVGRIEINGELVKSEQLARKTAYVRQFEDYYPHLTVKEHLQFYAELKLSRELNKEQIEKTVNNMIDDLQLSKCASSYVGNPGYMSTLSGGEYRRLVLASELLTDVPIITCDEPTTGLDSFVAQEVMSALRLIADRGKVVMCTIHQPSSRVFEMFDRLMLLSDGKVAFNGNREEAKSFFSSLELPVPKNMNPADFFIRTLGIKPGYEEACHSRNKKNNEHEKSSRNRFGASTCAQIRLLMWRILIMKWRSETNWLNPVAMQLIFTAIFCVIFWQQEKSDVGAQNTDNGLFMIFLGFSFFFLLAESIGLSANIRLTYKERNQNLYGTVVFLFSSFFSWIIWYTIPLILNFNMIYWCFGLPTNALIFFKLLLLTYLTMVTSLCFAIMYVPIINNFYLLTQFSNILLSLIIIPTGFWVNVRTIPSYILWLKHISWFSYTLDSLYTTIWKDFGPLDKASIFKLDQTYTHSPLIFLTNLTGISYILKECTQPSPDGGCIDSGTEVLKTIGFEKDNYFIDLGFLVLLGVAYMIIGQILFYIRARLFKE